ncbi:hypothetical protein [Burkholderia territorii]|uniref:hypothetical protein n=1 Tax=Burkholderia territorii TaxID=1503055 RepID=UPI00075A47D7|nr:hypothetical protein [Burkholderia territorii]KVK97917.1 hypothetical protein WS94_23185 [Burkholderia territorii]KVT85198.1 hypothetical protein WT25_12420 [Burkholderia territorii]KWA11222.1 hypothetical protein WT37_22675 [Burkholderia territorii]KWE86827.1 hypothetical protein WT54_14375 [Burkholderia territorii]KWH13645.1 hypothetical protein WT59_15940 [Burkholderia territorii]
MKTSHVLPHHPGSRRDTSLARRAARRVAWSLAALPLFCGQAFAVDACPTPFALSGNTDLPWKEVTTNQWRNMLPRGWTDNGFHFYSRVRSRGPENGINTPSDLESEIRKQVSDEPAGGGNPNRRTITLPIVNGKGQHLLAIYDYDGRSTSKCELVTLTYPAQ